MAASVASDPAHIRELKRFLVMAPYLYNYHFNRDAKLDVQRALYLAASLDGKYSTAFFADVDSDQLRPETQRQDPPKDLDEDVMMEELNTADEQDRFEAFLHKSKGARKVDPSHPGRPCVRKFKKGEPTYRCLTCGLDDTCVLCQYCFNDEDHQGHQVTVSISQQDSGGVCDCGDEEAWVHQFSCKYHSLENYPNDPIPDDLHQAILETVEAALDYTIDVFSNSHTAIQKFSTTEEVISNETRSTLSEEAYGIEEVPANGKYTLCLWNDQKHSFLDAITVILNATKKSCNFAEMVTTHIDSHGRGMVAVSGDLQGLLRKKKLIEETGLIATVRSARDVFREDMCAVIFDWLTDLSRLPVSNNYLVARDIISTALLNNWRYGTEMLTSGAYSRLNDREFVHSNTMDRHGALDGPLIPDPTIRYRRDFSKKQRQHDSEEEEEDSSSSPFHHRALLGSAVRAADEETATPNAAGNAGGGGFVIGNRLYQLFNFGDTAMTENAGHGEIIAALEGEEELSRLASGEVAEDEEDYEEEEDDDTLADRRSSKRSMSTSEPAASYWTRPVDGVQKSEPRDRVSSRVQYLIFFDIRLWKNLRTVLRDLYISVLVSNQAHKLKLGHLYAQIYPQIAELYVLADREPECSTISGLSTQLFTTPSIATEIVKYDYFTHIIAALYTLLTTYEIGPPIAVDPNASIDLDSRILRNRRFGQLFHDCEYILNRNTEEKWVAGNLQRIKQICDFFLLFQGQLPTRRQSQNHVEFESDSWVTFFNCIVYVLQLAGVLATGIYKCEAGTGPKIVRAIAEVIAAWSFGKYKARFSNSEIAAPPSFKTVQVIVPHMSEVKEFETTRSCIIDFNVFKSPLSLHHPLHVFLSWIIEFGRFENAQQLRQAFVSEELMHQFPGQTYEQVLLATLDHPIRVMCVLSQIQVGYWVRNGFSMRSQLVHYRELTLRDSAFRRDLLMVQTAMVVLDPATVVLTLLDRWRLLDGIAHSAGKEENLDDSAQRMYYVEELLHYLIGILMERTQLMGLSDKEVTRRYLKKEIVQALTFKNLTFSDLCSGIPDHLTSDVMFEDVVNELADFKPPVGVRDYGMYQLKKEYYDLFDPHYIHFSSTKIEEAEGIVRARVSKETGKDPLTIVIEPPLEKIPSGPFTNLSGFTRTIPFVKLVYDLFSSAVAKHTEAQHETIFAQVLQLLHIAALDDLNLEFESPERTLVNIMCRELFVLPKSFGEGSASVVFLLYKVAGIDEFQPFHAKIVRVLELLKQKDPVNFEAYVQERVPEAVNPVAESNKMDTSEGAESEAEKRKRLIKERQAKIMADFQKQQSLFAQQNIDEGLQDENEDEEMGEANENEWKYPESQCILCRMPGDKSSVFGVVGFKVQTNVYREVPFGEEHWVYEAYGSNRNLDNELPRNAINNEGNEEWQEYRRKFNEEHVVGPGFPRDHFGKQSIIVSCGHGVHYSCFKEYKQTTRARGNHLTRNLPEDHQQGEFLCPLCKSINNVFLPRLWRSNKRGLDETLDAKGSFEDFYKRISGLQQENALTSRLNVDRITPSLQRIAAENVMPNYQCTLDVSTPMDTEMQASINKALHDVLVLAKGQNQTVHFSKFIDILSNTVGTLEISIRGQKCPNAMGGILLEQIPGHSMTCLRGLIDLVKSTLGIWAKSVVMRDEMDFASGLVDDVVYSAGTVSNPFLLTGSSFDAFVRNVFVTAAVHDLDIAHLVRTYFAATVVDSLIQLMREVSSGSAWTISDTFFNMPYLDQFDEDTVQNLGLLMSRIRHHVNYAPVEQNCPPQIWENPDFLVRLNSVLVKSVTPFLRRCAIFVHGYCGHGYDAYDWMGFGDTPEIEKLCEFLRIPSYSEMIKNLVDTGSVEWQFLEGWLDKSLTARLASHVRIEYPSVYRLLKLPERLDAFFNVANHICASDDGEIPTDPAVCLFCGVSVSLQAVTFTGDPRGECQNHLLKCGKTIGIFLLPKRSSLLLLREKQGSFIEGPYLDLHGEADEAMRRGRPQFLHENRYENFTRTFWLQHGIPTYIARKLDSVIDVGGWETL
ncbi:hypothetical protein TRVA0_011S02454 [Trichomonascus vanleenenianus]|uniref:E3 ubiquitin-protein ligase UBR1 n=1 Tax=Trichomonascus vanleenenianus TaxID=2268995 RepID=UPI003EC9BBBF